MSDRLGYICVDCGSWTPTLAQSDPWCVHERVKLPEQWPRDEAIAAKRERLRRLQAIRLARAAR